MTPDKRYDRAYFDRWYRGPGAVRGKEELARQVLLAVAVTEAVLMRPVRSVLDVGAGEGRWQPALHQLRPEAAYVGAEPSEYAVERFGAARHLRAGSFGTLKTLGFDEPFDLVVCADVLHYLGDDEIRVGAREFADLVGGAALIEIFTSADPEAGDRHGFRVRPPAWYDRVLRDADLVPLGLQMWVHRDVAESLDAMELVRVPDASE